MFVCDGEMLTQMIGDLPKREIERLLDSALRRSDREMQWPPLRIANTDIALNSRR
jgi:hypothetical protein